MIGVLFISVFCAVGFAYACTEYLMTRFDVRQRVVTGNAGLGLILAINLSSFMLLWLCAFILIVASGYDLHLQVSVIVLGAQMIWLTQNLWLYYRDHVRVRYERYR